MAIKDISIYESGNGGDLLLNNNDLSVVTGLSNMVFLCLFGGNIEASTSIDQQTEEKKLDWFGNQLFNLNFNSNFERKLQEVALNSAGLVELETAAKTDLKPIEQFATVSIIASLIGVGKLGLEIKLTEPNNKSTKIKYLWDGEKIETYQNISV